MLTNRTISFFEFDSSGKSRLGSGNATDVLFSRRLWSPFFRIMQLEWRATGPKWRVRQGTLRVTDMGIEELSQDDGMLAQGALIDLYVVLPEIAYAFDLNRDALLQSVDDLWGHYWFSYSTRRPLAPTAIDEATAHAKLTPGTRERGSFVIQFAGTREQFSEVLNDFTALKKVVDRLVDTTRNAGP